MFSIQFIISSIKEYVTKNSNIIILSSDINEDFKSEILTKTQFLINKFTKYCYEIIKDETGKYSKYSSLNKAEIALFVREYNTAQQLIEKTVSLGKQLNEINQVYLAKDVQICIKIANDVETDKIKIFNQEIVNLFDECLIYYRKNKYPKEYYDTRVKYLEYISLFKEKALLFMEEINKFIEDLWLIDNQIFSNKLTDKSETTFLGLTLYSDKTNLIDDFYSIENNNNSSNKSNQVNYDELIYRNYLKIRVLLKLHELLSNMNLKRKSSFILFNIIKFSQGISEFQEFINYSYTTLLKLLDCCNISETKIDSIGCFNSLHNQIILEKNKKMLYDTRKETQIEALNKITTNNYSSQFTEINQTLIKDLRLFNKIKNELIENKENTVYSNELSKRRLNEDEKLNIFYRNKFYKEYLIDANWETLQHQMIIYSINLISLLKKSNEHEEELIDFKSSINKFNTYNVNNLISIYNNIQNVFKDDALIDKKKYELYLLQSLSNYLTLEQQKYLSQSLIENYSSFQTNNTNTNSYNLVKLPYLVRITPNPSNIRFEKTLVNEAISTKNSNVFLYNPWGQQDYLEYYWTNNSYQTVAVEFMNDLDIELALTKVTILFENNSTAFSFPSKFIIIL